MSLTVAWNERARLTAALGAFQDSARSRDLYHSSYRFEFKIGESEWECLQRASVAADGSLLGYLSASVDRDNREVTNITAISFVEGSVEWAVDLRRFMSNLVAEFEVVHWSALADTPNAVMYRRAAERLGGRVCGRFERRARRPGGQLAAVEWFEILGNGGRS